MRALLRIVIVFIFIFCCQGVFSFPAPEIQLPTAAAKFNISNTLTKTIYSWTDNRGTIYKQVDQAQQPNLVSVRNKNVVSFAPKSVLQSKSLTGPFVFPSAKFQLVALVSLFVRTERNTTVPFTFFTDSNDALTLQYEYDTKCFGFYWKNRGVQVCANDLVSGVNVGELNATLLFASLDKNLISLRIGGMSVENQVVEEFTGMNGWLVLGGSPYTASPFYGVIHSMDIYNSLLTDAEKFALHMQHIREYQLTAGSWQFWNYDTTYTKDFLALSHYAGKQVREGSSSAQFQITDVNALDSTDDVAASLCLAHNSSDALKWQANTGFGLMYVLNRHWKVIYVPGSSGLGHVNITVKDLSTVINGTSMPLTICYKENQSDKQCSLYSAVTGDTFNVVPRTGYYYLTLGTTCSVNTDCANFVKPVNATCNFECYQSKCYCMDRETPPIDEEPQGDEAVVVDPPRALGLWIYPLAIMLSVVVFAVAVGIRQWIKSRRDRVVVEHVADSINEEAIMTQN